MIDFSRFNSIFELTEYFNTEDKCRRAIFSVTVGTIFENTKISLRKWFILHKVRTLFAQEDVTLSGVVECDEMYLGGRETNKHETKKTKGTQGGAKMKTPVFGMTMKWKTEDVDTETGEVREKTHTYEVAKKVADTKASTIIPIIRHFVADGSTVVTDESSIYNGRSEHYNHVFVCHSEKEYATDSNVINLTVYSKFVNEGLDVNSDSYKLVIEDCMTASEDIINAIASENAEKISQYVSSL